MAWLRYFDLSLYVSLVCFGVGVLPYFLLRRPRKRGLESLPRYSGFLLLAVLVTSFAGYVVGFFGPLLLLPGDPLPFLGIFITGPLGAVAGLVSFWMFAFSARHEHTAASSDA